MDEDLRRWLATNPEVKIHPLTIASMLRAIAKEAAANKGTWRGRPCGVMIQMRLVDAAEDLERLVDPARP